MRAREEMPRLRSRWLLPLLALVLTLVFTACGGGGGGGSVSVQLESTDLDLILGGSETLQVTVTRSAAATAALSLESSGAPEWVSVEFAPAVLSGANLESIMTVATDAGHPDAAPTTFDLTVRAVGAGLSAQAQLNVAVDLQDVTGTVVDAFGGPVAGVTVLATGGTLVVTDAAGEFTFVGMTAPYDLTVIDSGASVAHSFIGLSSGAPRVQPISALVTGLNGEFSANLSGTLSHASLIPLLPDHAVTVCVEGLNGMAGGCQHITADGASNYNLGVNWSAPAEISFRVRAYLYKVDANGVPTAIVASGTAGPTVLGDGDAAVVNLALSDSTAQASMSVTTNTPSGYTLASRGLLSHYSAFASFGLMSGTPLGATDTLIAPFFTGAPLSAFAIASTNDASSISSSIAWSTGHASGDSTTLSLPVPPTPVAPPAGATDVSSTTDFTLANPAGGVVTFVLQPNPGPGPIYAVTTTDTTVRFPDLAAFGMGLPGGADYTWAAIASPNLPTVDAAVTGDGYLGGYVSVVLATSGYGLAPAGDGQVSSTDLVEITTQ